MNPTRTSRLYALRFLGPIPGEEIEKDMVATPVEVDTKEFSEVIGDSTVGFLRLSVVAGKEGADSAGTGVLVSVGKVHGVLTAAHVINALPKSGNVGLVTFQKFARLPHKLQIDMSLTGTICFSAPEWGQNGPDIGFLRLPEDVVGTLKARCLFRNLDIGEARFQDRPVPSSYSMDALAGVLDERTQTVAPASSPVAITREFEARFQIGNITPIPEVDGFDRCTFVAALADLLPHPASYEGTSGGGLWRVYFDFDAEKKPYVVEHRLVGIAYFQSSPICDKRVIFGHGPRSIYVNIKNEIKAKWADARDQQ
jgi:hypothetical protein